ncbi:PAS domain S-box protein [Salinigranum halophilum]|uniref:PAS domain S-box protein n=1 Tax=Salinigranum halophilum TaxID=2565931 RepID=UPI0010A8BBEE|nr:PAS domain S-box protein [Salinigranum halophilum]
MSGSSPTSPEQLQVLYEIALSIGRGETLSEVAQTALSSYLRRLNCSTGGVFERYEEDGDVSYRLIEGIPDNPTYNDTFEAATRHLDHGDATDAASFREGLPLSAGDGAAHYYIFDLPEFGVLVIIKNGEPLAPGTIAALEPLNQKLADACCNRRVEQEAAQTRETLRTVLDTIPQEVVVRDRNGRYTLANESAAAAHGVQVGELEGATDEEYARSGADRNVRATDMEVIESGEPQRIEDEELIDADGRTRTVTTDIVPLELLETERQALVITTDTTDRTERQAALERQATAMEASMDGISILNADGEYAYMNEAHAEIFGYDPAELLGGTWRQLYPDDEIERIERDVFAELNRDGEWRGETIGKAREGTVVHQEITLSTLEDGGLVCTNRDITEQKRREQALRRQRSRLRVLFDQSPDNIIVHDDEGAVLDVNERQASTLGYDRETLLDMNVEEFEVGIEIDELESLWDELSVGETLETRGRHRRADGSEYPIEVWVSRTEIEGETRLIALDRDISERVEREQRLQTRRRQLTRLHKATREVMAAPTRSEVADRASETVREVLGHPLHGIHIYDSAQDALVPVSVSDRVQDVIGDPPAIGPGDGIAWTAYESGETDLRADVRDDDEVMNLETAVRSELYVPLGDHGLIIVGSTEPDEFTEADVASAKILAANVEAALDRVERETRLKRTNTVLQTVLDNLPAGVLVEDPDRDILTVNQRLVDLFERDVSSEALAGVDCQAAAEDLKHRLDAPEQFLTRLDSLIEAREPVTKEPLELADGRTLERDYVPYTLPDGEANLWMYRDITSQSRRETAVRNLLSITSRQNIEFEQKIREVLEIGRRRTGMEAAFFATIDSSADLDIGGFQISASTGRDPQFNTREQEPLSKTYCRKTVQTADPVSVTNADETWRDDPAYEEFGLSCYIGRRVEVNGEVYGTLCFTHREPRDEPFSQEESQFVKLLTQWLSFELERRDREADLRETRKQLRRSNEELEQFAYAASHDLKEPLRSVSNYLTLFNDLYDEGQTFDAQAETLIEDAVGATGRMQSMINALLQYSRVDSRGGDLEPTPLDAVVEKAELNLTVRIDDIGATVTTEPLPTVSGDERLLIQLFQNLIDNGLKYNESANPRISITPGEPVANIDPPEPVALDGSVSWHHIRVEDNGIGMEIDVADRAFDVFERLGRTDENGTGMGLTLCQRIVEYHNGAIWLESAPGDGTAVHVCLPDV